MKREQSCLGIPDTILNLNSKSQHGCHSNRTDLITQEYAMHALLHTLIPLRNTLNLSFLMKALQGKEKQKGKKPPKLKNQEKI